MKQKGFMKEWYRSGFKYWYLFLLSVIPFIFISDFIQFLVGGLSFVLSDYFMNKVFKDMEAKGFVFKESQTDSKGDLK